MAAPLIKGPVRDLTEKVESLTHEAYAFGCSSTTDRVHKFQSSPDYRQLYIDLCSRSWNMTDIIDLLVPLNDKTRQEAISLITNEHTDFQGLWLILCYASISDCVTLFKTIASSKSEETAVYDLATAIDNSEDNTFGRKIVEHLHEDITKFQRKNPRKAYQTYISTTDFTTGLPELTSSCIKCGKLYDDGDVFKLQRCLTHSIHLECRGSCPCDEKETDRELFLDRVFKKRDFIEFAEAEKGGLRFVGFDLRSVRKNPSTNTRVALVSASASFVRRNKGRLVPAVLGCLRDYEYDHEDCFAVIKDTNIVLHLEGLVTEGTAIPRPYARHEDTYILKCSGPTTKIKKLNVIAET